MLCPLPFCPLRQRRVKFRSTQHRSDTRFPVLFNQRVQRTLSSRGVVIQCCNNGCMRNSRNAFSGMPMCQADRVIPRQFHHNKTILNVLHVCGERCQLFRRDAATRPMHKNCFHGLNPLANLLNGVIDRCARIKQRVNSAHLFRFKRLTECVKHGQNKIDVSHGAIPRFHHRILRRDHSPTKSRNQRFRYIQRTCQPRCDPSGWIFR